MSHFLVFDASLTGLGRMIVIIIVIYVIYSLVVRYILPALVRKSVKNFQEKFFEENPHLRKDDEQKKEGGITIRRTDDAKTQKIYNDAEDTEYEEIK